MKKGITIRSTLCVLLAIAGPACGVIVVDHTCLEVRADGSFNEIIPQSYLDQARQLKVLFCHASVGGTVMNGMVGRRGLADQNPVRYAIGRQENGEAAWFDEHSGIIDISHTQWPLKGSKVLGFDHHIRNLGYGQAGRANVAFMKYCYIDWQPSTNVQKAWDEYKTTLEALEADYPQITFVWWTTAINTAGEAGDVRERFNQLMRDYCLSHDKVLFDLADIESHDLQDRPCQDDVGAEGLYAGYAVDGAHPTGIGQTRLASALWWLLARIAGWDVSPTRINLTLGSEVLGANGTATTKAMIRLYDERNDLFVATPDRPVTWSLTGPGDLVGSIPLITTRGRATVTYRAGVSPGIATLTATSPGLAEGSASITLFVNHLPKVPTNPLCNGQLDPTVPMKGFPELTWTFRDPDADLGDRQSAYQLFLADQPADLDHPASTVWDTGKVLSSAASACPCVVPLHPGMTYYWKVRTWDLSGEEGPFSTPVSFVLAGSLVYGLNLGSGRTVDFGKGPGLDLHSTNGLTIEMWLYRTEEDVESILLDKFVWGRGGYRVGIDASNHVYFRTTGQQKGDRRVVALGTEVRKGRWGHVACCQLGPAGTDDGVIYVDGIECGRNGLLYSPWPADVALRLQSSGIMVEELRLSNTLRYAGPFTPSMEPFTPDGNTVGLWHFDEGQGLTTNDASGHGNVGTIQGDPGWTMGAI